MKTVLLALMLTTALTSASWAGFVISIADNVLLLPNTPNQSVHVYLKSDSPDDPALKGMSLTAYIGNRVEAIYWMNEGVFQGPAAFGTQPGVQMTGGGYFWDLGDGSSQDGDGPIPDFEALTEVGVKFNSAPQIVGSNNTVTVATFKIDTTGLTSGTYAISVDNPYDIFFATETSLITADDEVIGFGANFSAENGSFTISAVPEPTTLGLVGMGLACAARLRRRLKAQPNHRSLPRRAGNED